MQRIEIRKPAGKLVEIGNIPVGIVYSRMQRLILIAPTEIAESTDDVRRAVAREQKRLTKRFKKWYKFGDN